LGLPYTVPPVRPSICPPECTLESLFSGVTFGTSVHRTISSSINLSARMRAGIAFQRSNIWDFRTPYHQFVHPSVRYQTCEHHVLKTNEPMFLLIGTSRPWGGGGVKRLTLGVKRSKVKVTQGRRTWRPGSILSPLGQAARFDAA